MDLLHTKYQGKFISTISNFAKTLAAFAYNVLSLKEEHELKTVTFVLFAHKLVAFFFVSIKYVSVTFILSSS